MLLHGALQAVAIMHARKTFATRKTGVCILKSDCDMEKSPPDGGVTCANGEETLCLWTCLRVEKGA